jgi:hypothetical protein
VAAVEALPDKPKMNKQRKARARRTLTDLLARLARFVTHPWVCHKATGMGCQNLMGCALRQLRTWR